MALWLLSKDFCCCFAVEDPEQNLISSYFKIWREFVFGRSMGRRQDGLVHMELCKSSWHGLCQNVKVSKTCCAPELLHSEDWVRAADGKHTPSPAACAVAGSKARAGALRPSLLSRRSRAGWCRSHSSALQSCVVGQGPAGCVPSWAGDSCLPPPELPLPTAGIAHQSASPNGKRAKVWTQPWTGWLHAKADFCVDKTKASSLPFSLWSLPLSERQKIVPAVW